MAPFPNLVKNLILQQNLPSDYTYQLHNLEITRENTGFIGFNTRKKYTKLTKRQLFFILPPLIFPKIKSFKLMLN
jgi:hypothetical protein